VHAINLFAAGTAEGDVLRGSSGGSRAIRMSEIEHGGVRHQTRRSRRSGHSAEPPGTTVVELRGSAEAEAQRMAMARTHATHADLPEFVISRHLLLRQRLGRTWASTLRWRLHARASCHARDGC
jgi:hypothetical protein